MILDTLCISVIAITRVGDGDFRKAVVSGNTDKLYRYMMSRVELAAKKVRDAQAKGLNVTRFHFIENLNGFNLAQHACVQCKLHEWIQERLQIYLLYCPTLNSTNYTLFHFLVQFV